MPYASILQVQPAAVASYNIYSTQGAKIICQKLVIARKYKEIIVKIPLGQKKYPVHPKRPAATKQRFDKLQLTIHGNYLLILMSSYLLKIAHRGEIWSIFRFDKIALSCSRESGYNENKNKP